MNKSLQFLNDDLPDFKGELKKILKLAKITSNSHKAFSYGFLENKILDKILVLQKYFPDIIFVLESSKVEEKTFLYFKHINDKEAYSFFSFVEIKYVNKYKKLAHPDVLGAFLNNDIEYSSIGGIIVSEDGLINVELENKLLDIIEIQVPKISNIPVSYIELKNIVLESKQKDSKIYIVSSLRLDSIVKAIIRKNRLEAQRIIKTKLVSVDHNIEVKTSKLITTENIISIKKHGRYKVNSIKEKSNGKYTIEIR